MRATSASGWPSLSMFRLSLACRRMAMLRAGFCASGSSGVLCMPIMSSAVLASVPAAQPPSAVMHAMSIVMRQRDGFMFAPNNPVIRPKAAPSAFASSQAKPICRADGASRATAAPVISLEAAQFRARPMMNNGLHPPLTARPFQGSIPDEVHPPLAMPGMRRVVVRLRHRRRHAAFRRPAQGHAGTRAGRRRQRHRGRPDRQGADDFKKRQRHLPGRQGALAASGAIKFDRASYGEAIMNALEALQRDPNDKLGNSIVAVSGLRLSTKALADLSQENNLNGSLRSEAKDLAKLLRASLGEDVLVPAAGASVAKQPAAAKKAAPHAAHGKDATPSGTDDAFSGLK